MSDFVRKIGSSTRDRGLLQLAIVREKSILKPLYPDSQVAFSVLSPAYCTVSELTCAPICELSEHEIWPSLYLLAWEFVSYTHFALLHLLMLTFCSEE